MNNLIVIFIGVAIVLGLATSVIAWTYSTLELPETTTTEAIPGNPVPQPDDVGTLLLWLDADDSSTISIGVGVAQWDDKSGQGNHLVQAVTTEQPTILSSAINGRDAISFDGINDSLRVSSFTGGNQPQPTTVFLVYTPDSDSSAIQTYFDGGSGVTGERNLLRQQTPSGAYSMYAGSFVQFIETMPSSFIANTVVFDEANSEYFINGVSKTTGNIGTRTLNGVVLGADYVGNFPAETDIAMVLVYDGALTSDQLDDVHDYIETEFDLGMTLVGSYSEGTPAVIGSGSGWASVQTSLEEAALSATGLVAAVLVIIAAVIIMMYVKRIS